MEGAPDLGLCEGLGRQLSSADEDGLSEAEVSLCPF